MFDRGSRTFDAMGIRGIVLIALMISACRSGEIACPDITVTKLKSTVIRPGQIKKGREEEKLSASASTRYRPSDFKPRTDLKKAESIDEWDCPQPDKIRKLARDQKKRMEKQIKLEQKKRKELDTLTVFPATSRYAPR